MDEVIKLLHVRCPLKVVISYNYCDCREEMEINKLGFIAKYMKKWLENYPNHKEEYLIIIGNSAPKNRNSIDYEIFDYRGYEYINGHFYKI